MKPTLDPERRASARSLDDLAKIALIPAATPELRAVATQFSVLITPAMRDLIDADDPNDPIAAQFMPKAEELVVHPDESDDPISDQPFSPVKGVVHRYPDRVLLTLLLSCPVRSAGYARRHSAGRRAKSGVCLYRAAS
jgi:lysine 2,3-aminomutase